MTVLVTGSANGVLAPTTVLYSYKRIPQDIADNFPTDWAIGKSDSGWMTCEAFFEFVANVFYPWLVSQGIVFPVILFIDGHTSHISLQTSQFCEEKQIILVALCPNATHLIQPMDVAVFKPLKSAWRKTVHSWRLEKLENGEPPVLKRKDFAKLLHEVIDKAVADTTLINGFRKCGLVPWNPRAVQISNAECKDNSERVLYLKRGLQFLNENIKIETLRDFQSTTGPWLGDVSYLSL